MKEKSKTHNAPHDERFDPVAVPAAEERAQDNRKPTGLGWPERRPAGDLPVSR